MNKYRELLDYAQSRGLRIESGSKHTKLFTADGKLVQVISGNNSKGGRLPFKEQARQLDKYIEKTQRG
jgi:hypothetical protein